MIGSMRASDALSSRVMASRRGFRLTPDDAVSHVVVERQVFARMRAWRCSISEETRRGGLDGAADGDEHAVLRD